MSGVEPPLFVASYGVGFPETLNFPFSIRSQMIVLKKTTSVIAKQGINCKLTLQTYNTAAM